MVSPRGGTRAASRPGCRPGMIIVTSLMALGAALGGTACEERESRHAPAERHGVEGGPGSTSPTRVTLTPEAVRQAGITTEVVHLGPFAETLSIPARLSPTPEAPEEIEARLAFQAADARFQRASGELERVRKLFGQDVVASKALQAAEADFAQARIERLRTETALRSLGIDISRDAVYPRADLWALADAYDPQVPRVKPGVRVWIRVESFPGETFGARVVSLAAFLKPQTRTLTVRIAVQDPQGRLRPQEPAVAEVQVAERSALSVPASAVLYEGTDRIVFVKRGEGFEKIRIRVGAEQAGRAEILQGVADGDEVVTRGAQILLGEMFKSLIPVGEEGEEAEDEERD